jgi:hypothetical protein
VQAERVFSPARLCYQRAVLRISFIPCLLVSSVIACGGSQTPAEDRSADDLSQTMHQHLAKLGEMQSAVVQGDLPRAKTAALDLGGELKNRQHPKGWEGYLSELRKATFTVSSAADLGQAARATARAAAACGKCHADRGIDVAEAPVPAPRSRPDEISEKMYRHLEAANLMWMGVLGASDEAWKAGAESLASAGSIAQEEVARNNPEMQSIAHHVSELAEAAPSAGPWQERSQILGEFMASCSACHRHYLDDID